MPRKRKNLLSRQYIKLPKVKLFAMAKKPLVKFSNPLLPILPQILIIAVCIGIYYAMINFYLFFEWGFYIYYALKFIVAFELLSSASRSLILPVAALLLCAAALFTNGHYFNTLLNTDTAQQLGVIALLGLFIYFLKRRSSRHAK